MSPDGLDGGTGDDVDYVGGGGGGVGATVAGDVIGEDIGDGAVVGGCADSVADGCGGGQDVSILMGEGAWRDREGRTNDLSSLLIRVGRISCAQMLWW